jgi:hypothetical protein
MQKKCHLDGVADLEKFLSGFDFSEGSAEA